MNMMGIPTDILGRYAGIWNGYCIPRPRYNVQAYVGVGGETVVFAVVV